MKKPVMIHDAVQSMLTARSIFSDGIIVNSYSFSTTSMPNILKSKRIVPAVAEQRDNRLDLRAGVSA